MSASDGEGVERRAGPSGTRADRQRHYAGDAPNTFAACIEARRDSAGLQRVDPVTRRQRHADVIGWSETRTVGAQPVQDACRAIHSAGANSPEYSWRAVNRRARTFAAC